jgi:hypothetical protein
MNEAFRRFPDFNCADSDDLGCKYHNTFGLNAVVILRMVHESLIIAGSVDNLRGLMEPKPEMTFHDFNFSDNEATGMKHLQLFHTMKPETNEITEKTLKTLVRRDILPHPAISKFINSDDDSNFLADYAARFHMIFNNNAFGLGFRSGAGILPFGTFFNHACDQNIMELKIDNKFVFVVLKPIKKDEQLFVSYS